MRFDPTLDLELNRFLAARPAQVWRCWSEPALFCQWWTPKPVVTREAVLDLRAGGRFYSLMVMPDGTEMPGDGSFLEVVPGRKLVFTDLFLGDWQPAAQVGLGFAAIITMEPEGQGTRYIARARHRKPEERKAHEDMGFRSGWGTALTQLEALAIRI